MVTTNNMMNMPMMSGQMLGYAYVPVQVADVNRVYSPEKALERGTIFPELDIPYGVYGKEYHYPGVMEA